MRIALAVLMALHGVAHFVGFAVPWGLAKPPGGTSRTTILAGRHDLGAGGMRLYGLLWLLIGAAFVASAVAALTGQHWWIHWTPWVAFASLVMSILSWPESRIGVVVNLAILIWLHFGGAHGWWYEH